MTYSKKNLNIYKVSQELYNGWDTYDSMIVCAETKEKAIMFHPCGKITQIIDGMWHFTEKNGETHEGDNGTNNTYRTWIFATELHELNVELIGETHDETKEGVILASFNAG